MALPPYTERAWTEHFPTRLEPDGTHYTYKTGDEFYVPDFVTGRGGIYRCLKNNIITWIIRNPSGTFNTTDFDSHYPGDIEMRTGDAAPKIIPWVRNTQYTLGTEVYLRTPVVDYSVYYTAARSTVPAQDIFSVWLDSNYPLNEHNEGKEYVFSSIRNPGVYLVPRGDFGSLGTVPRWPGMLYLETSTRTILAYTDGKGPVQGWDVYATAETRHTGLVPGMIIGWLWSDIEAGPPLPPATLKCDGARYLKTAYQDLYDVIGDRYKKSGDATNTFRVPTAYNQIIFTGEA
jgi:hypothetical protein